MSWHAKPIGGYVKESDEAIDNATEIKELLESLGWSIEAICACLGNNNHEGQYNPWRWESDHVPTVAEYNSWSSSEAMIHGYGMWGFTPASKYIENEFAREQAGYNPHFADYEGSPFDGQAQTLFMDSGGSGWIIRSQFNYMTFGQFKESTEDLEYLTKVFLYCFENPANPEQSFPDRLESAIYWYEYFGGHYRKKHKLPLIYYTKLL